MNYKKFLMILLGSIFVSAQGMFFNCCFRAQPAEKNDQSKKEEIIKLNEKEEWWLSLEKSLKEKQLFETRGLLTKILTNNNDSYKGLFYSKDNSYAQVACQLVRYSENNDFYQSNITINLETLYKIITLFLYYRVIDFSWHAWSGSNYKKSTIGEDIISETSNKKCIKWLMSRGAHYDLGKIMAITLEGSQITLNKDKFISQNNLLELYCTMLPQIKEVEHVDIFLGQPTNSYLWAIFYSAKFVQDYKIMRLLIALMLYNNKLDDFKSRMDVNIEDLDFFCFTKFRQSKEEDQKFRDDERRHYDELIKQEQYKIMYMNKLYKMCYRDGDIVKMRDICFKFV